MIVSGGSLNKEFVTKVVGQGRYDRILAADSGMNALYAAAVTPDIIIGDLDIKLSDFGTWVYKYTNYNILQKNTCFFPAK